MRKTLKDWKDEWVQTFGITDGMEVIIADSASDEMAPYVYEGSFAKIPDQLLECKVIQSGRVLASSVEKRNGAFILTI